MERWRFRRGVRRALLLPVCAIAFFLGALLDSSSLIATVDSSGAAAVKPVVGHQAARGCAAPGPRRQVLLSAAGATLAGPASPLLPAHAQFGFDTMFDLPAPADVAGPPADAEVRPSGLITKQLLRPTCALSKYTPPEMLAKCQRPEPYDRVQVDYTGWKTNGRMIDSTRNDKSVLRLNEIIKGLSEGLQLMSPGEKRRFWIPANLAYGDTPADETKPAGMLVFDLDLYRIVERVGQPPEPPKEIAGVPADATATESGLAFKILQVGLGDKRASPDSKVEVKYAGWQTSGQLFMATQLGAQETFTVKEIPIKGLAEGIQLMTEGEKRIFWIPAALAFGDKPRAGLPAGMLVYEVELKKIS